MNYYVTVLDGSRVGVALGPFVTHDEALSMVDRVRRYCMDNYPQSPWWEYGTSGSEKKIEGTLNNQLTPV